MVINGFAGNSAFKTDEYFAKLASPLFLGFLTVKASEGRHSAFFPSVTEGGKEVLWQRSFAEISFVEKRSFVETEVRENFEQRVFRSWKEITRRQRERVFGETHLAFDVGSALHMLAENSQGSSLRQQSAMVSSIAWKADS